MSWICKFTIPPKEIRGNSRSHWRVKHKIFQEWKEVSRKIWSHETDYSRPYLKTPFIQRVFYFPDKRIRDLENFEIGMKAHIDGMVLAGCFLDDNWKVLRFLPTIPRIDKQQPRAELHLFSGKPEEILFD